MKTQHLNTKKAMVTIVLLAMSLLFVACPSNEKETTEITEVTTMKTEEANVSETVEARTKEGEEIESNTEENSEVVHNKTATGMSTNKMLIILIVRMK